MQRQAWQEGSSNSSDHNTNGREDLRRVQVQQKLKTVRLFFFFFSKIFKGKKRIGITDLLSSRSKLGDGGSSTVLAKSSIPGMFFTAVRY
jgi:hypothetical protein